MPRALHEDRARLPESQRLPPQSSSSAEKRAVGRPAGVYMWETQADAEAFYSGPWRDGHPCAVRQRSEGCSIFETVALTDKGIGPRPARSERSTPPRPPGVRASSLETAHHRLVPFANGPRFCSACSGTRASSG